MRPQPKTITVGNKRWTIRPLTLRQLEAMEPIVKAGANAGSVAYGLAVLAVALERDHPIAVADLPDTEASADELAVATRDCLRLGGYLEEPGAGESGAVNSAASTSNGSTDASPPAADTL